jgi:hypothetical protein
MSADLEQVAGLYTPLPRSCPAAAMKPNAAVTGPDSREPKRLPVTPRDIHEPDQHVDTSKVKARGFR